MTIDQLSDHDWLQIEQAAAGCVSGTSDEWPALRKAIEKLTGQPMIYRKPWQWLQGFCEGVMIQSGRMGFCATCGTAKKNEEMWFHDQCQMCWEAGCAQSWHDAMQ